MESNETSRESLFPPSSIGPENQHSWMRCQCADLSVAASKHPTAWVRLRFRRCDLPQKVTSDESFGDEKSRPIRSGCYAGPGRELQKCCPVRVERKPWMSFHHLPALPHRHLKTTPAMMPNLITFRPAFLRPPFLGRHKPCSWHNTEELVWCYRFDCCNRCLDPIERAFGLTTGTHHRNLSQ